jgi:hypothetical protein
MGHGIYGYKTKLDLESGGDNSVAYLHRGAFNKLNREIYRALDCEDCYVSCSGNSDHREVTKEQLFAALEYLGYDDCLDDDAYFGDLQPEIDFVNACLKNLNNENTIWIGFY